MLNLAIETEEDVVRSRMTAREVAAHLGFAHADQARIATAVSEIARNALTHGGGGNLRFDIDRSEGLPAMLITVSDSGPGIKDVRAVLAGDRPGRGLISAKRLMDECRVDSAGGGTTVYLRKFIYGDARVPATLSIAKPPARSGVGAMQDKLAEIHQTNRELAEAFGALRVREDELRRLNAELEDTNRGVVALYAELDAQAGYLRRADQLKSRFLSNMSHEFRTPLNSILALSQILLDRTDGELSGEQEKQVRFMRSAAQTLHEMVNDLLDLAKIEAGKVDVHVAPIDVSALFGSLRGMLRPLVLSDQVVLSIIDPEEVPALHSDEGKLAQILRNFVSNAIKFTERGEIRMHAAYLPDGDMVEFSVADTGIGIAAKDLDRIFDEFEQIESPLQKRVKGTGLGLPLCRRLAELMGGTVSVCSTPGEGSVFSVRIPSRYEVPGEAQPTQQSLPLSAKNVHNRALIIDDSDSMRYVLRKLLDGFEVLEAADGNQGLDIATKLRPDVIFLDLHMPGLDGYGVLARLRAQSNAPQIPVIVVTSEIDTADHMRLSSAQAVLSKESLTEDSLRVVLDRVLSRKSG